MRWATAYRLLPVTLILLSGCQTMTTPTAAREPRTVAEESDYRETSRHKDVQAFIEKLAPRTPHMKVLSMGESALGQDIPVLVLSRAELFSPAAAQGSGNPIVMIVANIHAGEVEGKEACLMLARDIALGPLSRLMEKATLVICPDYNPDGNDRIDKKNRALDLKALEGQIGPEGGVGTRYTGKGLNLNRDYMKLEAVESRLLMKLFTTWRPHLFVDCHTTDGSIHGYDLTFDTAHTMESGPRRPILYARDNMLPDIAKSLRARTGHRTFFYGNFRDPDDPAKGWETYSPLPRYGSHYRGLVGCMDVLLEAYSYIDFEARCDVMYETLVEILDYVAGHGEEIESVVRASGLETSARGWQPLPEDVVGIGYGVPTRGTKGELIFKYPAYPLRPCEIEAWDRESQLARAIPGKERKTYRTQYYGRFIPWRSVRRPPAYVFPAAEARVAEHLRLHGVAVRTLGGATEVDVDQYVVMGREETHSPDVGTEARSETVFWVRPERGRYAARPGDFIVEMGQSLANVAIYLLEPESDDGCARWGFFDHVKVGEVFPVRRVVRE